MSISHLSNESWRKSSRSLNNAHCVEVAVSSDVVGVRDTKDREGGSLVFGRRQWESFTQAIKDGRITKKLADR